MAKPHLLIRPIISSPHGRVIIYWALILSAVYLFREPKINRVVMVSGTPCESTAVAFLPPDSPVDAAPVKKKKAVAAKSFVKKTFVDLNCANESELCQIKGIGPVLAGRIVQYRKDNGVFSSIEELQGVKGIGPKTVAKLKNQAIRVGR